MTQRIEPRSAALNRFMMVPIVLALMLGAATGVLVYLMTQDRVADGERVQLLLSGECIPEAKSIILARAQDVGVGEPVFTENNQKLSFTLPSIPNAKEHIPRLLLQPGNWALKTNEHIILSNKDVDAVQLSLDDGGMPETLLTFKPASKSEAQKWLDEHPDDVSEIWLDSKKVIDRPNRISITDDFRLVSDEQDPRIRMQESADFVILLSRSPIPCEIKWEILPLSNET